MFESVGKKEPTLPPQPLGPLHSITKTQGKTSDSIEKSGGSKGSGKPTDPASPDLQAAEYILWFGTNNQTAIQMYGGKSAATSIGNVENLGSNIVMLQFENDMHSIAIQVLNSWSKSIGEEKKALDREAKSDRHRHDLEMRDLAGHEAYLQSLSTDQKANMISDNRLTITNISEGNGQGLSDYLSKIKAGDPNNAVPAVTGVAMSIVSQNSPLDGGSILHQVAPSYSVDMTTLSALFVHVAASTATMRTVITPGAPTPKIDQDFAKNYAQQILKELSSADFNSWAMAIVTHGMEQAEPGNLKNVAQIEEAGRLVTKLKLAMLTTAVALLYQTSNGIDGKTFANLITADNLPPNIGETEGTLLKLIRSLYNDGGLPSKDQNTFVAAATTWIDQTGSAQNLMKISPLFDAMKMNTLNTATISI